MAFDTELLGHFWPEGVDWLRAVIGTCEERGLPLEPLTADVSEASARRPRPRSRAGAPGVTYAPGARRRPAASHGRRGPRSCRPSPPAGEPGRALRELLALQASDWAFLVSAGTAGDYPAARAAAHREAFAAALADPGADPALRNLAPAI